MPASPPTVPDAIEWRTAPAPVDYPTAMEAMEARAAAIRDALHRGHFG
jgi:lipoyl(octanoyl) transferase